MYLKNKSKKNNINNFLATQDQSGLPSKAEFNKKFEQKNAEHKAEIDNSKLEKSYLRLTEKSQIANIRSQAELKKAYKHLKEQIPIRGYIWGIDQLRTIRQELTVLGIMNKFSLKVYFLSFKLSLLIKEGQQIRETIGQQFIYIQYGLLDDNDPKSLMIIYYWIIMTILDENDHELQRLFQCLSNESLQSKTIKNALQFKMWYVWGNYNKIIEYFNNEIKKNDVLNAIFEIYGSKIRLKLQNNIVKVFGPKIKLTEANKFQQFEDTVKLIAYLKDKNCVLSEDDVWLLNKESKKFVNVN